jgi:hypothetical protein
MLMKASKLVEMTHKWRLLREGHPLLRRVKIIPRWRRMHRQRLPRLMSLLLRRCECLRVDLFFNVGFCRT